MIAVLFPVLNSILHQQTCMQQSFIFCYIIKHVNILDKIKIN